MNINRPNDSTSETSVNENFEYAPDVAGALVHSGQAKLLIQRALRANRFGTKRAAALSRIAESLSFVCSALGHLEDQRP